MSLRTSSLAIAVATGALGILAACGDLKNGSTGDGGSSGAADSSSQSSGSSGTSDFGPGPLGALPTGYCCTDDSQCRNRNCATAASGDQMCLDYCYSASSCTFGSLSFSCNGTQEQQGSCAPPSTFKCLDPNTFERGTKADEACCTATDDGTAGEECQGGLCISYTLGDNGPENPFVCSHWCDSGKDCASSEICDPDEHNCEPGNSPYTCQ